jgi:hypothetical protein
MSSSDSDEEIGRRIDYSSDDEPKKKRKNTREAKPKKEKPKKEKPKEIPQQPVQTQPPPLPPSGRLTKARRDLIIQNFSLGKEDPEYDVRKLGNGSYRVSKRKSYYSPTANVESGSKQEIGLTWMNYQTQMNESLYHDVKKLRKKYEKLADKYESKHDPVEPPKPIVPDPIVPKPTAPPPVPQSRPTNSRRVPLRYKRQRGYDIRNF